MRKHLLQYGDIMFLDAQKRQYNKLCWPYIGPVIKTGENRIRVVAESVVISEDIEAYQWILESIVSMEPKWSLSKLRIVFSDGFITQTLLEKLNIATTCTLRCDYWHVIQEVLPKEHNFGRVCFSIIEPHLKKMLTSNSESEWTIAFKAATNLLRDYPSKLQKLNEIYDRPSYYAGYYVRNIPTNLLLLGSSPAESNHSSITKHLGDCGVWTISHQITKLMERQQYFLNQDQNHRDSLFVRQQSFVSTFNGEIGKHDIEAKKTLSSYAYNLCWLNPIKNSHKYQFRSCEKGTHFIVWRIGEELGLDNFVFFPKNGRCDCKHRISFGCPCAHEMTTGIRFDKSMYSQRWLCLNEFNLQYPHLSPTMEPSNYSDYTIYETPMGDQNIGLESLTNGNSFCSMIGTHNNELSQHNVETNTVTDHRKSVIGYNELIAATNELVRCVSSDQRMSKKIYTQVKEWTLKLRRKENFEVMFRNMDISHGSTLDNNVNEETITPLPSCTKFAPVSSAKKRKVSCMEYQKIRCGRPIPKGSNWSKTCGLCKGKGHSRSKCERLLQDYRKLPLPLSDSHLRNTLAMCLVSNIFSGNQLLNRKMEDTRIIMNEFPKKVKCLVIHTRYLKNQYIANIACVTNICIECTLIRENYEIRDEERKILFEPASITKYITTLSNLVLSHL